MPASRLCFTLDQAQHRLRKSVDRLCLARIGASRAQLEAMYFIRDHEPCAQASIATAFGQDESAVTGMLARMQKAGFISRERDPSDRRVSRVRLTEVGRGMLAVADATVEAFNRRLVAGFDEHELAVVQRFLDGVIRRLEIGDL